MSDLTAPKSEKNNLPKENKLIFSDPLRIAEVDKSNTPKNYNFKCAGGSSYKTNFEVPVSPGSEVYATSLPEDENFFDFGYSKLPDMLDSGVQHSSVANKPSKYNSPDEMDRALSFDKMNYSKTSSPCDASVKYNVDKQNVSSNGKNRNSTNFSIFGQLLNKKQNNATASRNSGNSNIYSLPQNSKQISPSNIPRSESSESSEGTQRAVVKTKLKSMWNNVKYGWRIKREVNLKTDSAIWLLGQCYHNKLNDDVDFTQDVAEQLRLDLLSKIWLTYRINFPAIPGTNLVTDSGWGCMLRCGQMMMAQAFVCHFLHRDWRISSPQPEDKIAIYKTILRWFGDSLSENSPFSLHHLVSLGQNYGRKAGDWYGPTHAAHVLRDALNEAKKYLPQLQQLCMYVASDGIVFKQDVMDLCMESTSGEKSNSNTSLSSDFATISLTDVQNNSSGDTMKDNELQDFYNMSPRLFDEASEELKCCENTCPSYSEFGPPSYSTVKPKWKSLILFVSVRLGNDKINPFYIPCLKSLLAYENCIGIIGGRPKHALYFIGWQDDKIIHMDPHSCQPAIDVDKEDFNEKSFHSSSVRTMSFTEMDPSCSIGFYFRELLDFQIFIEKFSEITAPLKRNLEYPVFALTEGKRIDVEDDISHPIDRSVYPPVRRNTCVDDDDDNDDDYILL